MEEKGKSTNQQNISVFNDKKINDYEEHARGIFNKENQKRIDDLIKNYSQRTPGEISLDVGMGSGNIFNILKKYFNKCYGLDLAVKLAKEKKIEKNNLIQGDGIFLPIKTNSIDLITAYAFLHHIDNPNDFFKESYRCLKLNGILYTDGDKNYFFIRMYVMFNLIKAIILRKSNRINYFSNYFNDHQDGERHYGGLKYTKLYKELKEIGFREINITCRMTNNPKHTKSSLYRLLIILKIKPLLSHIYIIARK